MVASAFFDRILVAFWCALRWITSMTIISKNGYFTSQTIHYPGEDTFVASQLPSLVAGLRRDVFHGPSHHPNLLRLVNVMLLTQASHRHLACSGFP